MTTVSASYPPSGGGVPRYTNLAAFPSAAAVGNGALGIALDTNVLYESNGASWLAIGSPGAALSIGAFDSGVASAQGAHIDTNALIMQSASATVPGLLNTGVQTLAGNKTFTGTISASNLSGTNTGDVTLTAVGAVPNANGASLAGQALTLEPADATHPGVLTAADWNTFNSKVPASRTISTTAPLTGGGNLGSDLTLAMPAATGSVNGYLTSTDWNTFNSKGSGSVTSVALSVPAASILSVTGSPVTTSGTLALATTGTAGGVPYFSSASALSSSGALTASAIVLGGGAGAAPTSLSLGTANQVVGMNAGASANEYKTLATGTTGTNFAVAFAANSVTFNLPDASASARGALTSADWTTFNNKVPATRTIATTAPLTGGGDLSADRTLAIPAATGSVNGYLTSADWTTFNNKGSGTVTSVAFTVPAASIFGATGTPVTTSGTLGLTTTGTSGGVPYFSSTSAVSSSALLAFNGVVLGGGAGAAPTTTTAGTANQVLRVPGAGGSPAFGAVDLGQSAAVTGILANGNTTAASANTASAIVTRDASGNFTAGLITTATGVVFPNGGSTLATYSETNYSSTFTWNGSGGTSASISGKITQVGRLVNLVLNGFSATTGTSSDSLDANSAISSSMRPSSQVTGFVQITDNGTTSGGMVIVTTGGIVKIRKATVGGTFANGTSSGANDNISISWYV